MAAGKLQLLQDMYQQWPFFQVTLDMVEMVFAKADPRVSLLYEEYLVDKELVPFGDNLRLCAPNSCTLHVDYRPPHIERMLIPNCAAN